MRSFFLLIIIVALIALTGCGPALAENTITTNSNQSFEDQISQLEFEDWNKISPQIQIDTLDAEDIKNIQASLDGERPFGINEGEISWDGEKLDVNPNATSIGEDALLFVVPTIQIAPQGLTSLYQAFVKNPETNRLLIWETLFHWTNHMENRYALSANGAWLNTIIRGAINGEGLIYEFPGAGGLQRQFLFVTKISANGGSSYPWAVILAENGAPVTGFNTAIRHEKLNPTEAANFLGKMINRGYVKISAESLPREITNNWGSTKAPPVIRYIVWALAYQVEVYARVAALSVAQAATELMSWVGNSLVTPLFFVVPDCEIYVVPGICETIIET